MSPVVVVKDYGGYVNEYAAQTEVYRRTNREVRIHECHSACTMALGLPNVCVYPDSVFKFHQAYDPRNHVTNFGVSDQLFNTYPVAVRERLGTLTKRFTVLRGTELIQLGIRDCNEPQPRIMIARATQGPLPESIMSGGSTLSMLTGKMQSMIPHFGSQPSTAPAPDQRPSRRTTPAVPDGMLGPRIPLPPEKPTEVAIAAPDAVEPDTPQTEGVPLPPPRPKILIAYTPGLPPIPMVRIIGGAQQILPAHFVPFPKPG
jgi:hypothetical protein